MLVPCGPVVMVFKLVIMMEQVQRQLEDNKRRDESHAALMAAVLRRRNLLDTTDGNEVASSIESRVSRTQKLQIVYNAGTGSGEHRTSVASPTGLLAPTVENGTGSLFLCLHGRPSVVLVI